MGNIIRQPASVIIAGPEKWRLVLKLFLRLTTCLFGYFMLDLHPASDDCFRLWSHLTKREGKPLASHAGVFRGPRFSSLPTNTCSTENVSFPLFYLRGK